MRPVVSTQLTGGTQGRNQWVAFSLHGLEQVIFSKLIFLICKMRRLDLEYSIGLTKPRHRGVKYSCTFWEVLESQHFQGKGWIQGGMKKAATQ